MKTLTTREKAKILKEMLHVASGCSKILMNHFRKNLQIREKHHAGLVSNADLESERMAIRALAKIRPDFGFLTEESRFHRRMIKQLGRSAGDSPGLWILDPLDGTTNYVHGLPIFCVSLAAWWENQPLAAVIMNPVMQETFFALKNKGAFLIKNGKKQRLRVSSTAKLKDTLLSTGFSYEKGRALKEEIRNFDRLSRVARGIRRPGSAALDLAWVAQGVFDGYWELKLCPWDVAAGILLVEEAGGRVSNFQGGPVNIHHPEIVAGNPHIHAQVLRKLRYEN